MPPGKRALRTSRLSNPGAGPRKPELTALFTYIRRERRVPLSAHGRLPRLHHASTSASTKSASASPNSSHVRPPTSSSAYSDQLGPKHRGIAPAVKQRPIQKPWFAGPITCEKMASVVLRPNGNAIVMSAKPARKRPTGSAGAAPAAAPATGAAAAAAAAPPGPERRVDEQERAGRAERERAQQQRDVVAHARARRPRPT